MKTYTKEDIIKAYKKGVKDYCKSPKSLQAFLEEEVKKFEQTL